MSRDATGFLGTAQAMSAVALAQATSRDHRRPRARIHAALPRQTAEQPLQEARMNAPVMPGTRHRRRMIVGTLAALAACPSVLCAQTPVFPSRPVQLVVAAPAGGPSDAFARMLADDMAKILGQPIVIDNRAGAGGSIAAEAVAHAAPDGHMLMLSWIGNATSQTLLPKPGHDINRDFVHITQLLSGPNVLVAHPSTGFRQVQEVIAFAKANPGELSYASSGMGSSGHLAMEMLKERSGARLVHIPYRGGAPALNDLLAGRVQLMFINLDAVILHIRGARLVPLAITSGMRNPLFPDLPTVAESGFPGFEATAWAGLSAPHGTPAPVVERLHAAAAKALHGPMRMKQEAIGAQVIGSTPAQYAEFVRSETDKWAQVIKRAGIKAY
jgi:tripartite-type tricarboxylate transporter receptor subunit TctC